MQNTDYTCFAPGMSAHRENVGFAGAGRQQAGKKGGENFHANLPSLITCAVLRCLLHYGKLNPLNPRGKRPFKKNTPSPSRQLD
jgi:hypothetical protein